LFKEVPAIK